MNSSRPIRTRYAPSPTGFQHIGGIRTALYCYLFTRNQGGSFILRIEDTDRTRFVEGAEEYIVESLNWCGIECDEGTHVGGDYGPYRQSDRKAIYAKHIQLLLDSGNAYYAFDTPSDLEAMRERLKSKENPSPQYNAVSRVDMQNSLNMSADELKSRLDKGEAYVVRIKVPEGEAITFTDIVRGEVTVRTSEMDDKVLMKGDGMPTYHFANVVDDYSMKISHVIRGEEWLPSTPLHVLLYRSFGWENEMPEFAHLPLLLKPEGNGKLSKRDGDRLGFPVFPLAWEHPTDGSSSGGYREMGFLPDAFVNMLGFLGWNPGTEQEIFSKEELISAFSLERVNKAGAKFDFDKAKWFNQQYLRKLSDSDLADIVSKNAPEAYKDVSRDLLVAACGMMKERMTFVSDFWDQGAFFFDLPSSYDPKVVKKKWKEDRKPQFVELKNRLASLSDFGAESVENEVKAFIESSGLGFGNVLQIFRLMLAGTLAGPSIFDMAALLGKDEVIKRMEAGATAFDEMLKAREG